MWLYRLFILLAFYFFHVHIPYWLCLLRWYLTIYCHLAIVYFTLSLLKIYVLLSYY